MTTPTHPPYTYQEQEEIIRKLGHILGIKAEFHVITGQLTADYITLLQGWEPITAEALDAAIKRCSDLIRGVHLILKIVEELRALPKTPMPPTHYTVVCIAKWRYVRALADSTAIALIEFREVCSSRRAADLRKRVTARDAVDTLTTTCHDAMSYSHEWGGEVMGCLGDLSLFPGSFLIREMEEGGKLFPVPRQLWEEKN